MDGWVVVLNERTFEACELVFNWIITTSDLADHIWIGLRQKIEAVRRKWECSFLESFEWICCELNWPPTALKALQPLWTLWRKLQLHLVISNLNVKGFCEMKDLPPTTNVESLSTLIFHVIFMLDPNFFHFLLYPLLQSLKSNWSNCEIQTLISGQFCILAIFCGWTQFVQSLCEELTFWVLFN